MGRVRDDTPYAEALTENVSQYEEVSMSQPAKKRTQKSAKSAAAIGKKSKGFTDNAVVVLIVIESKRSTGYRLC